MMKIHNYHCPPCCGECPMFRYEDTDGYGECKAVNRNMRCSDVCLMAHDADAINRASVLRLLHYMQKWRRAGKSLPMLAPWLIGAAIDYAIHELRKNDRRRIHERAKRLA